MRTLFTARVRRAGANWIWPLALLALPGCGVDLFGTCTNGCVFNVDRGPTPHSGVVFCDIEKPSGRHCASDDEINQLGIRLAAGAEALVAGKSSNIGLDYSAAALTACSGRPQAVSYEGPFPDGKAVCLDCRAAAPNAGAAVAVCVAECEDLTAPNKKPPDKTVADDCAVRAHLSINAADPKFCFDSACSGEQLSDTFMSPRRDAEPVQWTNLLNVTPSGSNLNTLSKNATGTNIFDAGAASAPSQTIDTGDGYVEFTATGISTRVVGLSHGAAPDTDPNITDIDYGLDLFKNGCIYIYEKGNKVNGPVQTCSVPDAWGAYTPGERLRVSVTDNFDGTATVSYARVTAACHTHVACEPFKTSAVHPSYPLRVDVSFHDDGATVGDVVIVRIR
jgi:hypothetical protein